MTSYSIPAPAPLTTRKNRPSVVAAGIECVLWIASLTALGYCGWTLYDAWRHQVEGERMIANAPPAVANAPSAKHPAAPLPPPPYGSAVARIEIERLGLSTIVFEGTGQDVLSHGAGHLRQSPLPGQTGNVVVAGHRDTFFRELRDLKVGDQIKIETTSGSRNYVVEWTRVVHPDNTTVLSPTRAPVLTLVTCYPFRYIGSAPDRFIARCREIKDTNQVAARPSDPDPKPDSKPAEEPAKPDPGWMARVSTAIAGALQQFLCP